MTTKMLEKKRELKPGEMIRLSYDEAFKIMYGDPANIEILTMFLSKVLGVKYEDIENKVTLIPLKTPKNTIGEKITERDVVVKIQDTSISKIILEVNINTRGKFYQTILKRNLLYLYDEASSGITTNDTYENIPTTILFNFNNFFINAREKVIDEYLYRNEEGDILTDSTRIVNINIEKCYKLWYYKEYEGLSEREKEIVISCALLWIEKIIEFNDCLKELEINPEIEKLMEKVVFRMNQDEGLVRRFYRTEESDKKLKEAIIKEEREEARKEWLAEGRAEGRAKGRAEGRAEGRLEGIEEKMREMVISLNSQGVNLDIISKASGLNISEIKKIIEHS